MDEKLAGLRDKGLKLTIQRKAVLEYLRMHAHHPTAEEIYEALRESYPSVSRATVYNSLDVLKRHELIREITIERNKARYECDEKSHHHFMSVLRCHSRRHAW
jgi:Fur family peroxide stress response transcriptional regulator